MEATNNTPKYTISKNTESLINNKKRLNQFFSEVSRSIEDMYGCTEGERIIDKEYLDLHLKVKEFLDKYMVVSIEDHISITDKSEI